MFCHSVENDFHSRCSSRLHRLSFRNSTMLNRWCSERNSCPCHNYVLHLLMFVLAMIAVLTVIIFHQLLLEKTSPTKLYRIHEKKCQLHERHFNITVWDKDVCERMFENLRQFPKFPSYPDRYDSKNNFSSVVENTDEPPSIKRVQFYLRPIESGLYKFRVRSSVPLRVSMETSPQSPEIIVILESSPNDVVYSRDHLLMSDHSYYFELVLFCLPGENFFDIDWLVPGSAQFRPIEPRDFEPGRHVVPSQHPLLPVTKVFSPNQHILLGFIPRIHIIESFPPCRSYVNFTTSNVTQDTVVYTHPSPLTRDTKRLVHFITQSFQKAVPSKYPSLKIMKMESNYQNSTIHFRRLLVDLELVVDGLDYELKMSEYFFNWDDGSMIKLCRPSHYHWNELVTLNFVYLADCHDESATVWVDYFIENMIEILTTSLDVNIKVIITTCDEQAARSYESSLRRSGFDRYAVELVEGVYTQSRGMRAALSLVEDDDSIVVLCQSRVKMPTMIVEEIRKHTFNNTMAYSPVPFQLECGYFPDSTPIKGQWCEKCSALLSLYKRDWKLVLTDELVESSSDTGTRSDGFLKDKVLSHISKFGIEIFWVKLKDLYRL